MISLLGRILCRVKGHRWGKPITILSGARIPFPDRPVLEDGDKYKRCRRCGKAVPVKARKARSK